MEFWIVWLIGIVVVIATRIAINICQRDTYTYTYEKSKIARIIINLLIIICIVIVGGIPVQNTSGTISRSRGTIQTTDNLTYWYLNENGEGTFDSALAENSNIVFLEESQSPYVEIVVYFCTNILIYSN